jgi:hypothetical protein
VILARKEIIVLSRAKRIRDLSLETLLALVLVGTFVAFLFKHPTGVVLDWRRIALVTNTLLVFGFLISWFRDSWKRWLFWGTLTALFLLHMAIYKFAFSRAQSSPLVFFAGFNLIELTLFAVVLSKLPPRRMGD